MSENACRRLPTGASTHKGHRTNIATKRFAANKHVKNFIANSDCQTTEKPTSGGRNITNAEVEKTAPNKTDDNNTELSIYQSEEADRIDEREAYKKLILKNIEFDIIKNSFDKNMLTEIVDIITDIVCSNRKTLFIEGDYLIPNLTLPSEEKVHIGKYGMLWRKYLKEHKKGLYSSLMLTGKLTQHLLKNDQESRDQIELSMLPLTQTNPPPCKPTDQIGWVQHMNNLKYLAEEQVLKELVYN